MKIFFLKFIGFIFILTFSLFASSAEEYIDALKLYHNKMYSDAYPIIKKESIKGNKEAQYLLAHMYENGLGVVRDMQKALFLYKKIPSEYRYITKEKPIEKDTFEQRVREQMSDTSERKRESFIFSKVDSSVPEVKSQFMKMLKNDFGLLPYKSNYLIPFSYSSSKFKRHSSTFREEDIPKDGQDYVEYDSYIETEYQLSFQKPLTYNLIGWNESISFAYTQQVWWKLYDDSSPFRETNYLPELFMVIPTSDSIDKHYNLKAIKFGYRHQSNGQEGYQSRSWNRLFLQHNGNGKISLSKLRGGIAYLKMMMTILI